MGKDNQAKVRQAKQLVRKAGDRNDLEKTLFDHEEHLLPGRTETDIVYELLLKLGLDLCVPIESRSIAGKTVGAIGGGVLLACLSERITAVEVEALPLGRSSSSSPDTSGSPAYALCSLALHPQSTKP